MQNSNSKENNFYLITDTIKRFYDNGSSEIQGLIDLNIINTDNFKLKWKTFDLWINKLLGIEPVGTTGIQPSFSSYIEIENQNYGDLTRIKRVHYFVSLLGPFYSIICDDISQIEVKGQGTVNVTNFLTVSPEREYEKSFNGLEHGIEGKFNRYHFVPFSILQFPVTIPQSSVEIPLFDVLFKSGFDLTKWTMGNKNYKEEFWLKQTGGFSAFPGKV